ncbi:MAG: rhomboid family intramembrane serine protease [Chitinophagales bacterium]
MQEDQQHGAGPGLMLSLGITLGITAILWLVFLATIFFSVDLTPWGIRPHEAAGLVGIVTAPFIHGDIWHLTSNTLPFAVMFFVLLNAYHRVAFFVLVMLHLLTGLGVWLFAQPNSSHIGISGIIYGLAGFLIASGFFRKDRLSLTVAVFVVLLYSSLLEGFIPQPGISWQSHLSGAVSGVVLAWLLKRIDPPADNYFDQEPEERPFFG